MDLGNYGSSEEENSSDEKSKEHASPAAPAVAPVLGLGFGALPQPKKKKDKKKDKKKKNKKRKREEREGPTMFASLPGPSAKSSLPSTKASVNPTPPSSSSLSSFSGLQRPPLINAAPSMVTGSRLNAAPSLDGGPPNSKAIRKAEPSLDLLGYGNSDDHEEEDATQLVVGSAPAPPEPEKEVRRRIVGDGLDAYGLDRETAIGSFKLQAVEPDDEPAAPSSFSTAAPAAPVAKPAGERREAVPSDVSTVPKRPTSSAASLYRVDAQGQYMHAHASRVLSNEAPTRDKNDFRSKFGEIPGFMGKSRNSEFENAKFIDMDTAVLRQKTEQEERQAAFLKEHGGEGEVSVSAGFYNSRTGTTQITSKVGKLHKRKHQINQLAASAAAQEHALNLRRAAGYAAKNMARSKYGF